MHRLWKRLSKFGIGFIIIASFCLVIWKEVDVTRKKKDHLQEDYLGHTVDHIDINNEAWLLQEISKNTAGNLVCLKRKPKIRELGKLVEEDGEIPKTIKGITDSDIVGSIARNPEKKVSISQLSPTRPIGCCPPGDSHGIVYRLGSACCNNVVYNVSTHFCCLTPSANLKIMKLHVDELNNCYSPEETSLLSLCNIDDLDIESKYPMKYKCEGHHDETPNSCEFICPDGSRPKNGIEHARCSRSGIWNRRPICCQGCDASYQLDLWFLVETTDILPVSIFLKEFLTYFPISQERVRVGIHLFNESTSSSGIDLFSHDNRENVLNNTLKNISFNGDGKYIGAALSWLARNGFTKYSGDRQYVDNMVIAILQNTPNDSIFKGAKKLKYKSDVISIGVGYDIDDEDLSAISTGSGNFYRTSNFNSLVELSTSLHDKICGDSCIFKPR